jgi:hypothetical protein
MIFKSKVSRLLPFKEYNLYFNLKENALKQYK